MRALTFAADGAATRSSAPIRTRQTVPQVQSEPFSGIRVRKSFLPCPRRYREVLPRVVPVGTYFPLFPLAHVRPESSISMTKPSSVGIPTPPSVIGSRGLPSRALASIADTTCSPPATLLAGRPITMPIDQVYRFPVFPNIPRSLPPPPGDDASNPHVSITSHSFDWLGDRTANRPGMSISCFLHIPDSLLPLSLPPGDDASNPHVDIPSHSFDWLADRDANRPGISISCFSPHPRFFPVASPSTWR